MFRITDIVNIAVQIEKNGEKSYREAGEHVTNPEVREMLLWMAEEETRHRNWFESFQDDTPVPPGHEDLEKMGRNLLQDMVADETFSLDQERLNTTDCLYDLLAQSKAFEEDTILFYEFIRGLLEDEDAVQKIDTIIEEERKHAELLGNMAKELAGNTIP